MQIPAELINTSSFSAFTVLKAESRVIRHPWWMAVAGVNNRLKSL